MLEVNDPRETVRLHYTTFIPLQCYSITAATHDACTLQVNKKCCWQLEDMRRVCGKRGEKYKEGEWGTRRVGTAVERGRRRRRRVQNGTEGGTDRPNLALKISLKDPKASTSA